MCLILTPQPTFARTVVALPVDVPDRSVAGPAPPVAHPRPVLEPGRLVDRPKLPLAIEDVRAATLVLSGAQDRTFLPSESREIADTVAHGRFVEVQGAGHLPFVEKPSEVAQAIESFLR